MTIVSAKVLTAALASLGIGAVVISLLTVYVQRKRRRRRNSKDEPDRGALTGAGDGGGQVQDQPARAEGVRARAEGVRPRAITEDSLGPALHRNSIGSPGRKSSKGAPSPIDFLLPGPAPSDYEAESTSQLSSVTMTTEDISQCSTQQLCNMGLEHMNEAIKMWEEAEVRLSTETTGDDEPELMLGGAALKSLVQKSRVLLSQYQVCAERDVTVESAVEALRQMDREYEEQKHRAASLRSLTSDESDLDSFVSANEMPDLSDLEDEIEAVQEKQKRGRVRVSLYEEGLRMLQSDEQGISVRRLRTSAVGCMSDSEFLAKVFALRKSFNNILLLEKNRDWFFETGTTLLADVMRFATKDPSDFLKEMDKMTLFLQSPSGWEVTTEELSGRGVKDMTFYDIVLDFMLMDAFDDLAMPPSSVLSITSNRWISNSLKETAISTAVWSVMKAKKKMLKNPEGFLAHFYAISEQVSPTLAWGFLGPPSPLKDVCFLFKDQVMGFIHDIFDPVAVRYTSLDLLSSDVLVAADKRAQVIKAALLVDSS